MWQMLYMKFGLKSYTTKQCKIKLQKKKKVLLSLLSLSSYQPNGYGLLRAFSVSAFAV